MTEVLDANLQLLVSALLGGGLFTGIGQLIKARADARKAITEAKVVEETAEQGTDKIAADAIRDALQAMRDLAADANAARGLAETAEQAARERGQRIEEELRGRLSNVEATNRELCTKVQTLEQDKARADAHMALQTRRITRLEGSLTRAYDTVRELVTLLRTHAPEDVPHVDYSIFDVHQ